MTQEGRILDTAKQYEDDSMSEALKQQEKANDNNDWQKSSILDTADVMNIANGEFNTQPINDAASNDKTNTWLNEHGLSSIVDICVQNEITIDALMEADTNDIKIMCTEANIKTQHRLKLQSALRNTANSLLSLHKSPEPTPEPTPINSIQPDDKEEKFEIKQTETINSNLQQKKHDLSFKVLLIGDSAVGKSCVLTRFRRDIFLNDGFISTIGVDFATKKMQINDKIIKLQVWDTAGQERFASLGVAFYRGADAVILVYDVSDRTSFENLTKWKQDFIENGSPKKPNEFPFIIFGNKTDLPKSQKHVHMNDIQQWISSNTNNSPFYETSAKDNNNVEQGFKTVGELAINYNQKIEGESGFKYDQVTFEANFNQKQQKNQKCKCILL